jgi:Zn-dependent protease
MFDFSLPDIISIVVIIAGVFYSIILHEIAHGLAAYSFGDETAKRNGRISLNPFPHIDILGSIIVPIAGYFLGGFVFGWAKPVPINPNNFKNIKLGEIVVSLAGVFVNFSIFILLLLVIKFAELNDQSVRILLKIAQINFGLFYFNLLPIPPLDGYHFLANILPSSASYNMQKITAGREIVFLMILLALMNSPIGRFIYLPANLLHNSIIGLLFGTAI